VKNPKKKARQKVYDEEGLSMLASCLKQVRLDQGFTQEELAYQSELTLSQIARIETVKTNPTVSTIFKLSRVLNVPVSALFEFKLSKKSK
jgi:transcriptional regulator with XRE-family HTH domain